ncbi:MAG: proline dehydrogenase family protein, partial [Planctomycetota bacterium]
MNTAHAAERVAAERRPAGERVGECVENDASSPRGGGPPPLVEQAVALARFLQQRAAELQTPAERRQQAELSRMLPSPGDKATLMQLTDLAFRATDRARSVEQLTHVLRRHGVPRFFAPLKRAMLHGFRAFGSWLPNAAMPLVHQQMRREAAGVVLPFERERLRSYLGTRRREGVRVNINHLGEAVLGEREAQRRAEGYAELLRRPEVEVISVKASTLYSQVSPLARDHTVEAFADRLQPLFRVAGEERFTRPDGSVVPKLVYLDMEAYHDLHLTADALVRTLDRAGMEHARAGIALQAYLPDSFGVLQRLLGWARRRAAAGGPAITVRLVKGANLEMERVEASVAGWPQAPYTSKTGADANYARMLHETLKPENRDAVRVGIASHNLFTLAYGLVAAADAAADAGAMDRVQFEMLEGMAAHQRRALFERCREVLLYTPTCGRGDFLHAIGYLVRRLDENTGRDNFLRHAFDTQVDSDAWRRMEGQFVASFDAIDSTSTTPRRTQDRRRESWAAARPHGDQFVNEPDTDWSLPHHAEWAESILERADRSDAVAVPGLSGT